MSQIPMSYQPRGGNMSTHANIIDLLTGSVPLVQLTADEVVLGLRSGSVICMYNQYVTNPLKLYYHWDGQRLHCEYEDSNSTRHSEFSEHPTPEVLVSERWAPQYVWESV